MTTIQKFTYSNGERTEDAPRDLPVDKNGGARHQVYVATKPLTACEHRAKIKKYTAARHQVDVATKPLTACEHRASSVAQNTQKRPQLFVFLQPRQKG